MAEPRMQSERAVSPDETREMQLDAEAETAYRAGRAVPHDRVREWLTKLGKGERVQPLPQRSHESFWPQAMA